MTEEQKKMLHKLCGHTFIKPGHGSCCTCQRCGHCYDECICTEWDTWPDLEACMEALVREGKWELFIFHTLKTNRTITEWSAWLFRPVNEAGEAHFCALVAEFLKARDDEDW